MFGIEGRYAHALFSVASKQNSIEKVEKELADYQVNPIVQNLQHWVLISTFSEIGDGEPETCWIHREPHTQQEAERKWGNKQHKSKLSVSAVAN